MACTGGPRGGRRNLETRVLVGANRDVGAWHGDRVSLVRATVGAAMCSAVAVSSDFESYYGHVLGRPNRRVLQGDVRARTLRSDPGVTVNTGRAPDRSATG